MNKVDYIPCGEKERCCGCTSCVMNCPTQAIQMLPDDRGFTYPSVDADKCTHCGLCKTVCPVMVDATEKFEAPLVYGAKNKDDEIRKASSSGGFFSALAETMFDLFGDAVVYGCAYDEQIVARHERAISRDGIARFRGSKYVQSDMGVTFAQVKMDLNNGNHVLFTGTPCQIGGLKAFLRKDYSNLLTMDIICHGVMSPALFYDHIRALQKKKGQAVAQYYNRSKILGWKRHVEEIVFVDGTRDYSSVLSQAYKQMFHSCLSLRDSCYQCRYSSLQRVSDLTIGDFWGIEDVMPEFCDELGVSIVLVNTEKGTKLLNSASRRLELRTCDYDNDAWKQQNLKSPTPQPENCTEFWNIWHDKGYGGLLHRYTYYSPMGYLKLAAKKLLGMYTNG